MTPSARVQATLELLEQISAEPRPADALVSAYFRARRFIGSKDRAAISSRLYSIMRHQARLDWWLEKSSIPCAPRARMIAWLALGEQFAPSSIEEICASGKYVIGAISDEEKHFLKKTEGGTVEHPDMPEETLAECPPDLAPALRLKFGAQFLREMRAMQEPATLDLRINPLKTTREHILSDLRKLGLDAKLCELSPWGVRVFKRPALNELPMLKNGLVEIQDEGSQLVALVVGAHPGERIVDFCAGAGGKTLAIAAMMQNKGRIFACDVMEKRLKRSTERFRRAGIHNVETKTLSSERDPWVKKHKGSFDRVLTDAPCSGTGTWRRNPDARWRSLGPGLANLLETQEQILESASRLVKPGGRLIYATCSLLPEENENQIEKFIENNPDFSIAPCGLNGEDFLSLSPARHNTDGFFAASMVKKIGV